MEPDKYKRDVAEIVKREERWVGEAVVARNDINGNYELGKLFCIVQLLDYWVTALVIFIL